MWEVSISIKTVGRGVVKVEIDGLDNIKQPQPKTTVRYGNAANADMLDAYAILKKKLPRKEDFDNVLKELQELEGAWRYFYPNDSAFTLCSPTFNFDGDLLFELRRMQADARSGRSGRMDGRNGHGPSGGGGPNGNGGRPPSRPSSPSPSLSRGPQSRPGSPVSEVSGSRPPSRAGGGAGPASGALGSTSPTSPRQSRGRTGLTSGNGGLRSRSSSRGPLPPRGAAPGEYEL